MKKIILALCTLGLLASCSKKSNNEPQAPYISTIEENTYSVLPDTEEQGDLRLRTISKLRPDGQTLEYVTTGSDGALVRKATNEYNAQGKITRTRFEETGASSTTDFEYNKDGLLIREIITPLNGEKSKTEYGYNQAGHKISTKSYDMDKSGTWETTPNVGADYEVDSKGLILVSRAYNQFGPFMTTTFTYDAHGYAILTENKSPGGDMDNIKRTRYVEGKPGLEEHIEQEISFAGQKMVSVTDYKYTFDEKGNWTKQIRFNDGKAVEIRTRTYTYK